MTVKLRGLAGGVIEVDDDTADRYLAAGYTKADTGKKAAPATKPAKRRKES